MKTWNHGDIIGFDMSDTSNSVPVAYNSLNDSIECEGCDWSVEIDASGQFQSVGAWIENAVSEGWFEVI